MENLTTYALVGLLTVTSTKVSGSFYSANYKRLYKDFGASHFDKIDLKFDGLIENSDPYGYGGKMVMGFSNTLGDPSGWTNYNIKVTFQRSDVYGEGDYYIYLTNPWGGSYDECVIDPDTVYYLTLTRDAGADTATLKVYTDSDRTTLYDTLAISGLGTTTWRYFYAASSYYEGDSSVVAYGYYENYLFGGAIAGQVRVIGMML